jgi:hypothetical protein
VGNVPPATYSVAINVLPKLTVWRNVNFGGEAYDVFEPGEFGGVLRTEASSIKVNTINGSPWSSGAVLSAPSRVSYW